VKQDDGQSPSKRAKILEQEEIPLSSESNSAPEQTNKEIETSTEMEVENSLPVLKKRSKYFRKNSFPSKKIKKPAIKKEVEEESLELKENETTSQSPALENEDQTCEKDEVMKPKKEEKKLQPKKKRVDSVLQEANNFLATKFNKTVDRRKSTFSSLFAGLNEEEELKKALEVSEKMQQQDEFLNSIHEKFRREDEIESKFNEAKKHLRAEAEQEEKELAEVKERGESEDYSFKKHVDEDITKSNTTLLIFSRGIFLSSLKERVRSNLETPKKKL